MIRPDYVRSAPLVTSSGWPGWAFLFWWVLANTLAVVVGWMAVVAALWVPRSEELATNPGKVPALPGITLLVIAAGAIAGVVVATAQWLVLRNYFHGITPWLFATTIGWVVASLLFGIGGYFAHASAGVFSEYNGINYARAAWIVGALLVGGASGLVIGIEQAPLLRNYFTRP